jgi:Fic family protein
MIMDNLNITSPKILSLIAGLEEYKGRFGATHRLTPEKLSGLKKIATIESIGSSTRIEGVKLTNSEIEKLLSGIKIFSFRSRDEQEIAGYAELMETIFTSWQEIELTENNIKQLHKVLLKYSEKDAHHRGNYKKQPNRVEAFDSEGKSIGIIFETATPFNTPFDMQKLVEKTNTELSKKEYHPLIIISLFTIEFLRIHPFQDGNGRLSRAITTLLFLRSGYSFVPYSSFEKVIEENKEQYYLMLRRGQTDMENGNNGLTDWVTFFLKCMQNQKLNLEKKLETEALIEKLPELSIQIIEIIKARGQTSLQQILKITNANRNTIKAHLKKLTQTGYLEMIGRGKGAKYVSKG